MLVIGDILRIKLSLATETSVMFLQEQKCMYMNIGAIDDANNKNNEENK